MDSAVPERAVVVMNPQSGKLPRDEKIALIEDGWPGSVVFAETSPDDSPDSWLPVVRKEAPDLILAAGGDGTVRHIVQCLLPADVRVPVAHVPMGTANVVARSLGFAPGPRAALQEIRRGHARGFDVGQVDDDFVFLVAAAAGLPARMIDEAPRDKKNQLGFLAYLQAGFQNLDTFQKPHRARIRVDDEEPVEIETAALVVANLMRFEELGVELGRTVDPHDGHLRAAAVTAKNLLEMAWLVGEIVAGREGKSHRLWAKDCRRLEIEFDKPCRVQADGEDLGDRQHVVLRALDSAVELVVPETYKA